MLELNHETILSDIRALKDEIAVLHKSVDRESKDTSFHIKEIHKLINGCNDRIIDLSVIMENLVHKNYPGNAAQAEKLDALNKGSAAPRIDRHREE